ncbi:metallophosphoesterase [Fulvivirga sp. 29W222]|uniref:Metallophosphoesterase n=1 Tax=Fulvivirga marina TaxID=2494733 RepID=A0A937KEN2_9BACT|nr:metallophosphoesterase [Fulvivirga marina]MBL6449764.1 metallophosphoesterase [Fulvivirga marina]
MKNLLILAILGLVLFFSTGIYGQRNSTDTLSYSVFLIGDAGKITPGQQKIFEVLKQQLALVGENSGLIFLGDNLYPKGMPPAYSTDRAASEDAIDKQLSLTTDYKGKYYFVPGNHDWAQGRSYGWDYVQNQENYIEGKSGGENVFLPDNGCPGPVAVSLSEEVELIIVDTQWFLHGWDKPNELQGDCPVANPIEVMQLMDDIIKKNPEKKIIVATHHPMYSYGNHGGFNTVKDHFFPLTELASPLYIPMPVVGSIYPFFRKVFGNIQDISHPKYKAMRNSMVNIFENYPNLIHVSGHEHALQYINKDSIHYIVSGSGCKTEYVRTKGYAEYTESVNGFARLDFYKNGEVRVEFWKPSKESASGKLSFEKTLFKKSFQPKLTSEEFVQKFDLKDSVVFASASNQYGVKKGLGEKLMGANYRAEWRQKIEVPVFDIGGEHGGLKIVQRGGGMQTKSLRLEASNGKQYVLRSVEKYPENAVPAFLRETFAVDLVQDQISAAHPYGAFVIPPLAEAVGIYHTNPKLVYIPDDPRFGDYQSTFANTLALYEERPDDDWSDASFFGNSEKIVSTSKVLDKLVDDNDNEVDQQFVLKSRLFDLVIGDWDRHDDQWRWAKFEKKGEKGDLYRPIPRDRDQVFFVNEGLLPGLVSRRWALPKLEGFDYDVRWPSGFMFNARYFDRSFLTGLSKEDWEAAAEAIQNDLTDAEIEAAIRQWPDSIYALHGKEVVAKIKARRDKLKGYALEHYLFLAREVDVVGSDKHEYFHVKRLANGDVHVEVLKMKKDGEKKKKIYSRLFKLGETEEVRLYGLGGEDEFLIEGDSKGSIKVRVIGGEDEDIMKDQSHVAGLGRRNIFYDTRTGNDIELNAESKKRLSSNPKVHYYNRKEFKYDVLMPLVTGNLNPDDGLFVGGGFMYTTHGFRKEPYKSKHTLLASYALKTSSYDFRYSGDFIDAVSDWNLSVKLSVKQPNYVNNFFGLGNESEFNQDIDETTNVGRSISYYRLRFQEMSSDIGLYKRIGGFATFSVSHKFQAIEIEDIEGDDRFITDYSNATGEIDFDIYKSYTGGAINLTFDKRNSSLITTSGVFWSNEASVLTGISHAQKTFSSLSSSLAFYYTLKLPSSFTMATRFGVGTNLGDYEFYQAQVLDGKSELRGYRKTRFYGDSKLFNNFEVRWNLLSFRTYIFPASMGILAFNDIGRVWLDGEDSNLWHHGYGGGLWIAPFNTAVVSAEVGHSVEETLFYIRLGFMF